MRQYGKFLSGMEKDSVHVSKKTWALLKKQQRGEREGEISFPLVGALLCLYKTVGVLPFSPYKHLRNGFTMKLWHRTRFSVLSR